MSGIDIGQVAGDAANAMLGVLGAAATDLVDYAKAEATKLATSALEIAQLRVKGIINDEELALHLEIQKHASRAVLMAIKGIGIIAAEQAINAAFAVIRNAVNAALPINVL